MHHTLTLKLYPSRSWLALGPGWAVVAAFLASGGPVAFKTMMLIQAGLLWLLADPLLGSLWQAVAGDMCFCRRNVAVPAVNGRLLPYTAAGSVAYRVAVWWTAIQSAGDGRWQTAVLLAIASLGVAAWLGGLVLLYALVVVGVALWLGSSHTRQTGTGAMLWQLLAMFLLPYLTGLLLLGGVSVESLLIGGSYGVVYGGILWLPDHPLAGYRLMVLGQAVAAFSLFALVKPLSAVVVVLAAGFTLLAQPADHLPAERLHPYLLIGWLAAAIGGIG